MYGGPGAGQTRLGSNPGNTHLTSAGFAPPSTPTAKRTVSSEALLVVSVFVAHVCACAWPHASSTTGCKAGGPKQDPPKVPQMA
jgi:hypothetical protein